MSGQPYKYAKDVENFRNNYMESLKERADLDDMNLQANKIYKNTGVLPPKSTTMKDMRITSEILADTEKLKLSLMSDLKDICSPQMASLVIQRVQQSPLNGDGSFLIWFAQNAPELASNLKKKYKFGIAGDANDAEQLYLFLQSIYSKTKDMNTSVKSAFDRPAGSDSIGASIGDFVSLSKQYDELYIRLISRAGSTTGFRTVLNRIKEQIDDMSYVLNNPPNRYQLIKDHFINASQNTTSVQQADINSLGYDEWLKYTDKLPSPSSLRALFSQLQKSEANANENLTITILENIESMLPKASDSQSIYTLTERLLRTQIQHTPPLPPAPGYQPRPPAPPGPPPSHVSNAGGQPPQIANAISNGVLSDIYNDYESITNGLPLPPHSHHPHNFSTPILAHVSQFLTQNNLNDIIQFNHQQLKHAIDTYTGNDTVVVQHKIAGKSHDQFIQEELPKFNHAVRNQAGYSMIGFGIHQRRGRPKGTGIVKPLSERIDRTKGIKQGSIHVPFGKYIINKNKLDSDIISFKHEKGYGVKGYPMNKVSKNLGNVMRTIIGGGVPKFEDLNNLSHEEKVYLHNISNKVGIMDKLSIPAPSKDKLEQDIHQFEVMKGEILAGNDSTELIKKFKLLLLRLSKNGTIPKAQATELMEDLITLGY